MFKTWGKDTISKDDYFKKFVPYLAHFACFEEDVARDITSEAYLSAFRRRASWGPKIYDSDAGALWTSRLRFCLLRSNCSMRKELIVLSPLEEHEMDARVGDWSLSMCEFLVPVDTAEPTSRP